MSTEYPAEYSQETVLVPAYTAFWPSLILMVALILWTGYQAFSNYRQEANLNDVLGKSAQAISASQKVDERLVALVQDLVQTSAHDASAAQIVRDDHIPTNTGSGQ